MDQRDDFASTRRFAPTAYRCYFAALDAAYRIHTSYLPPEDEPPANGDH
jgi:hypothetical protein